MTDTDKAQQIAQWHAIEAGIHWQDLVGPKRTKRFYEARKGAIREIRERTNLSLTEIGAIFGGRDHTTIINALKGAEK